ncbi:D-alanyl-D-alanine carboxypeptidase [Neptunitalea chrysea]|uniref:D-alanyl-D-alanine carboxypeptidase n=1 Tax=Neptunitalea chrysea TaxID=1647581 RepID=A0A9W6B4E4_9FLAO|nr:M15 family metallopeptidase [Neptunitalea chrysea]GLB52531.1 D-alanyl-D-alanine carboxypeptidase [Neptunitalea chrysea]
MKSIGKLALIGMFCLASCNNASRKSEKSIAKATPKEANSEVVNTSETKQTTGITKAFVLGKFDFTTNPSFTKIGAPYASKNLYLKKETFNAFKKMYEAAKKDGVTLTIISGTRNFNYQKGIWERKWEKYKDLEPLERAKKILEYSSMPSTSRHHWGTDMDINNLNNSYFESGAGRKVYNWLQQHAHSYGFYQVYTDKSTGRPGYSMEKWHWSYTSLAKQYLNFYNENINYSDINGFKGSELAKDLYVIKLYVNGVNKM